MGYSHFKSNVIGFDGSEYIATFNKVQAVTGIFTTSKVTTASANIVKASGLGDSSYIQIGVDQYIFVGPSNAAASVVLEASNLVGLTRRGSLYLGRLGGAWFFKTNALASRLAFDA